MSQTNGHKTVDLKTIHMGGDAGLREARCMDAINKALEENDCTIDSSIEIRGDQIYPFVTIKAKTKRG